MFDKGRFSTVLFFFTFYLAFFFNPKRNWLMFSHPDFMLGRNTIAFAGQLREDNFVASEPIFCSLIAGNSFYDDVSPFQERAD